MDTPIIPQKRCSKCKQYFPTTNEYFGKCTRNKDGLQYSCKLCNAQYHRDYCANHREESRAKVQRYREKFPEKQKQRDYERYWSDPERERKRIKEMRKRPEIKEREKKNMQNWIVDNYDKVLHNAKIRRDLKRSSEGKYSLNDIKHLYSVQQGTCAYCHIELNGKYHIDHIYPLSRGGSNWPSNLALACPTCNMSKHNKTLKEWEAVRGW